MKPTYKEQFDKLTRAYIHGQVDPYEGCACFVGNLLNRNEDWIGCRSANGMVGKGSLNPANYFYDDALEVIKQESEDLYTAIEILSLENNFLLVLRHFVSYDIDDRKGAFYEDTLFKAFESTLELLKQIHITKGEVIEGELVFEKRRLETI